MHLGALLPISHDSSSEDTISSEGTTCLPRISTNTSFPTCPTISLLILHLRHLAVPNIKDKFESYSFPFSLVSPILPSTYPLEWFMCLQIPIYIDLEGDIQF